MQAKFSLHFEPDEVGKVHLPMRHVNARPASTPCSIHPKKSVSASFEQCGLCASTSDAFTASVWWTIERTGSTSEWDEHTRMSSTLSASRACCALAQCEELIQLSVTRFSNEKPKSIGDPETVCQNQMRAMEFLCTRRHLTFILRFCFHLFFLLLLIALCIAVELFTFFPPIIHCVTSTVAEIGE